MLTAIEHATRRIRILGATAHPGGQWIVQQARNLCMDLDQAGADVKFVLHDRDAVQQIRNLLMDLGDRTVGFRFLVRDRAGQFSASFDAVLADAGIQAVKIPLRSPRAKQWVSHCTSSGRLGVFCCCPGGDGSGGVRHFRRVHALSAGAVWRARRRLLSLRPCARVGGLGPGGG